MSGIALLRRLLMKQAMKKSKDASGIMSLNKNLVNDVDNTVKKWVDSAKSQGQDIDKMGEQELKYLIELNKPKGPTILGHPVIDATSSEGKGITNQLTKQLERLKPKESADVLDLSGKKIPPGAQIMGGKEVIVDVVSDTVTQMKAMTPMDAMKEANLVIARKGKYKNLTIDESQDILKKTNDHIFERDIKYDEFGEIIKPDPEDLAGGGAAGRTSTGLNYLLGEDDQNSRVPYAAGSTQSDFDQYLKDREQRDKEEQKRKFKKDFEDWKKWQDTQGGTMDWAAEGGRIGFGLGGGFNAARRAFLKLMGAGAAGTVAAKSGLLSIFKGGGKKAVIKDLTSVPIKDISGMPAWFKPLVNKVIKEGDDVSKRFATGERQIVHQSTLPDSKTNVLVTQDLTSGDVVVDVGMGKHGFKDGHLGQPVRLEYKAAEDIMTGPDMDDMYKVGERDPHIKVKSRDEMTFDQKKHPNKTPEEFWVEEAEFTGGHPENIKFEETSIEKFGSHGSNFDEVEKFATGKVKKVKSTKKKLQTEHESGKWEADYDDSLPDYEDFSSGGRVPFIFGGGAIKTAFKRLKDVKKIPHGEKMLQKNPAIQHLLSKVDKQALQGLETQFSDQLLKMLKKDRELFLHLQSNKAMKDEGLDFLMKHMQESMAPHMKKYKSIEEIDAAILNMENIIKNKVVKEGRQVHATGGRVPLAGGKGVMSLIELITKKFGKDTAKRASQLGKPQKTLDREMFQNFNKKLKPGKDSKSIIPKDEYAEYRNDFNKEILNMSPEDQLRDEFPGISDKLIRQILTDKNPQRIAEVKQTMREALKMQEKGMGHEEIIEMFKKTPRTKNASGGRVSLSAGGLAGMLGE